eukprot:5927103-Alexandrium_andersonii.AAC.1
MAGAERAWTPRATLTSPILTTTARACPTRQHSEPRAWSLAAPPGCRWQALRRAKDRLPRGAAERRDRLAQSSAVATSIGAELGQPLNASNIRRRSTGLAPGPRTLEAA